MNRWQHCIIKLVQRIIAPSIKIHVNDINAKPTVLLNKLLKFLLFSNNKHIINLYFISYYAIIYHFKKLSY